MRKGKLVKWGLGGACLALVVIQLVPYGRGHTNPPVVSAPEWDSMRTRELFERACGDCHSNKTEWPWYSHVAPVAWLVRHDVEEARSHFNVSRWGIGHNEGEAAAEMVRSGEMTLWYYVALHPEARLSEEEKERLIEGLVATFGDEGEQKHEEELGHEHGESEED